MMKRVHNLLRGSLQVDIRGAAIERFLNLCAIHDVAFWDIRMLDADHFTAWVSVGGYFALHPYARKTACRVRVCKKRGVPFAARRMTRRWALWTGLIVCTAVIYFLSGFVWTIEVQGCEKTTPREILQLLQQAGLQTGTRRSDLSMRDLRNQVMMETDKLSYLTVNFKGTQAIVQVWERENNETKPTEPEPCNVVSHLTGIILRLRVRTGTAAVKVGDTLQPGDLIASGVVVNENDETDVTLLHAEAEADLRTWYTIRTVVPAELQLLTPQEQEAERVSLLLGQQRFPLGIIEKNAFPWYDKQINTQYLHLHENFRWPIALVRENTRLCSPEDAEIDQSALAEALEQRMTDRLLAEKPGAELVQAAFSLEKTEQGAYQGVLKVELVETTGREVPIG